MPNDGEPAGERAGARPVCFVLMPFGTKRDPAGESVNFDVVYEQVIKPAVEAAGLAPIRADEERAGGIIHKPMFERLVLSEYAVADLTLANANVYYELGVRHALRPYSTALVYAGGTRLPFDLGPMRALPYDDRGDDESRTVARDALRDTLVAAREATIDSPVFQLVDGLRPAEVDRLKTDVFRDRVAYSNAVKDRLAEARTETDPRAAVRAVHDDLGPLEDVETGIQVDLLLSYRSCSAWVDMIALVEAMPASVARSVLVREQYALALNRDGRGDRAERVLEDVIADRGPSSETLGILGRVHKDRWQAARDAGDDIRAKGLLTKAINAYLRGFEADWRDAYPGINAVTLMHLAVPPDERRHELLPVVAYSVRRRIHDGDADYWDHATLLELAVLDQDEDAALDALADAVAANREPWEADTTLNNIREIGRAQQRRGDRPAWVHDAVESELERLAR